jgi:hypothetical protein
MNNGRVAIQLDQFELLASFAKPSGRLVSRRRDVSERLAGYSLKREDSTTGVHA